MMVKLLKSQSLVEVNQALFAWSFDESGKSILKLNAPIIYLLKKINI